MAAREKQEIQNTTGNAMERVRDIHDVPGSVGHSSQSSAFQIEKKPALVSFFTGRIPLCKLKQPGNREIPPNSLLVLVPNQSEGE